jgi:Sulfotransferase family
MPVGSSAPPQLFVIGSGRSGTTIVLEGISCLDGLAPVPRLAGRAPRMTALAARMARRGIGPAAWTRASPEATGLFREAGLTGQLQARLGRPVQPDDVDVAKMERFRRRLESVRANSAVHTVVVKNTASCARVPVLASAFPDAAFVHVLRHPARVVMSLLRTEFWNQMTLWWDGRSTQQYAAAEGLAPEEVAAQHWSRQVRAAHVDLSACAPTRFEVIRFEDFVEKPLQALYKLEGVGVRVGDEATLRQRLRNLNLASPSSAAIPPAVTVAVEKHCAEAATLIGITL